MNRIIYICYDENIYDSKVYFILNNNLGTNHSITSSEVVIYFLQQDSILLSK